MRSILILAIFTLVSGCADLEYLFYSCAVNRNLDFDSCHSCVYDWLVSASSQGCNVNSALNSSAQRCTACRGCESEMLAYYRCYFCSCGCFALCEGTSPSFPSASPPSSPSFSPPSSPSFSPPTVGIGTLPARPGMSKAARVGLGVGCGLAGIALFSTVCLIYYSCRRRKNRVLAPLPPRNKSLTTLRRQQSQGNIPSGVRIDETTEAETSSRMTDSMPIVSVPSANHHYCSPSRSIDNSSHSVPNANRHSSSRSVRSSRYTVPNANRHSSSRSVSSSSYTVPNANRHSSSRSVGSSSYTEPNVNRHSSSRLVRSSLLCIYILLFSSRFINFL